MGKIINTETFIKEAILESQEDSLLNPTMSSEELQEAIYKRIKEYTDGNTKGIKVVTLDSISELCSIEEAVTQSRVVGLGGATCTAPLIEELKDTLKYRGADSLSGLPHTPKELHESTMPSYTKLNKRKGKKRWH